MATRTTPRWLSKAVNPRSKKFSPELVLSMIALEPEIFMQRGARGFWTALREWAKQRVT